MILHIIYGSRFIIVYDIIKSNRIRQCAVADPEMRSTSGT